MGEVAELIAQHAAEAIPALKKIAASRGKLQGNFYFACDGSAAQAGLIVTLTARDPKGGRAASQGKKLRRAIPGARFARGTITTEGKKLQLTLYTGNATVAHLKKSIKSAFEDKALSTLKRLLRAALITTPGGPVEEPEESESTEQTETLTAAERVELDALITEQGPLIEQSRALMEGFLSVGEETAERAEIVASLSEEIAAMEAAGLHGLDALTDKRRELAVALSTGELPDNDLVLPQELRHLLTLSTEQMTASVAVFHSEAWKRVCVAYEAAWGAVSGQLGVLQGALRADSDPELNLIAEGGIPGLLLPHQPHLSEALSAATDTLHPERIAAVGALAVRLAAHLDGAAVRAVDDNPLGVSVGLRAQLLPTLDGLSEAAGVLSGGKG